MAYFSALFLFFAAVASHADYVTVDLNVALFENSGWTEELTQEHLQGVRDTYAQCGVRIGKINLIRLNRDTTDLIKFDFAHPNNIAAVAEEFKNLPRPLIMLVKNFSVQEAQDRPFSRARFTELREKYPDALMDTVWMPFSVNGAEYKATAPYYVLAHELTHVFTLDGLHNNDTPPNLMTISRRRTNFMHPPLCKALRASRFVLPEQPASVSLIGNLPNKEFPNLQIQVNKIWEYEQSEFAAKPLSPPQIYFYDFERARESADFVQWQNQWLLGRPEIWRQFLEFKRQPAQTATPEWIAANVQGVFPFPPNFVALFYEGTDRLQVSPTQSYLKYNNVGYGFYTTAHEMLHYVLEQSGVPVKLHHCIFVSAREGGPSPMAKITRFLIEEKMVGPVLNMIGLRTEESMQPCAQLSEGERAEAARH